MAANSTNFTLNTDLNVNPYYDDYDPNKGFYRMIFKPGQAVQARELTQMQTILQKQVDRFGEHMFKEGSLVSGGNFIFDLLQPYVKIRDTDYSGANVNLSFFANVSITGANSGVQAIVIDTADGEETTSPDLKTLFIRYTGNGGANNSISNFVVGERINANTGITANVATDSTSVGFGSKFTIGSGVLFAKDHFIAFPQQSIILDKYSRYPSAWVGFEIEEDIITPAMDQTLNDPAAGAYNYAAPGADRLKLTARLVKYPTANTSQDFIHLFTINRGIIEKRFDNPQYAVIAEEWARRTYDESGNYFVYGMQTRIREHLRVNNNGGMYSSTYGGNNNLLAVGIEPGKAYIQGYEISKLVPTYVFIEKGIDFEVAEQQTISANYGNYLRVDEFVGSWNVNSGDRIELRNAAQDSITSRNFGNINPSGSVIGYAKLRAITHETGSGNPGANNAVYRMHLYDVKMTNGSFTAVKSLHFNNSGIHCKADTVLTGTIAALQETSFQNYLYGIQAANVKTIRDENNLIDTTYSFTKTFTVSIGTNGQFTLSSGSVDEIFPYAAGALNPTEISEILVSLDAGATVTMSGTITTNGTTSATGTGFNNLNVGDQIEVVDTGQTVTVVSIGGGGTTLTVYPAATADASSAYRKKYFAGSVINFALKGGSGNARTVTASSATSVAFDMKETLSTSVNGTVTITLNKVDAREIAKRMRRNRYVVIRPNTNIGVLTGPWDLGFSDVYRITSVRKKTGTFAAPTDGTDVTAQFVLDNGQRDTHYDHALLKRKTGVTVNHTDYLLVKLDYFEPDTTQGSGYFSVDSYPIDDVNGSANTNAITTQEIPYYTSKNTSVQYNLRDCIDTRPVKQNSASDATVVGSATTNPAIEEDFVASAGGIMAPVPNSEFISDIQFYLPRKDLIVMNKNGTTSAIKGIPSQVPITPVVPDDAMGMAIISVAPYPSLPYEIAARAARLNYANQVENIAYKRYTMRDIGVLEDRITNLEYYVTLSMLEKNTMDTRILDADGLDRFKNGILVDPFTDFNVSDIGNPDYLMSLDKNANELRPTYTINNIKLKYSTSSSGVTKHDNNVVTLPYTLTLLSQQPSATTGRSSSAMSYSFTGTVFLSPESDYWVDTTRNPDLVVVDTTVADLADNLAKVWGTQWNAWQTVSTGTKVTTTTNKTGGSKTTVATTTTQVKTGTQLSVNTTVQKQSYGDRVTDVSVAPYIRTQIIKFRGVGFKPNTRLFLFFDGENMTNYIRQTNSAYTPTKTWGQPVVTDANGIVYGQYYLPNNNEHKFRTGEKSFRLTESSTDSLTASTFGETTFAAEGLIQSKQKTIVSTEVPKLLSKTVSETQTLQNNYTITLPPPPATPPVPPGNPDPPPSPPPPPPPPPPAVPPTVPPKVPYTPQYQHWGGTDMNQGVSGDYGYGSGPGADNTFGNVWNSFGGTN